MSKLLQLRRCHESRQPDTGERKRLQNDLIPYQIIHTDESYHAVNHMNLITAIDNTWINTILVIRQLYSFFFNGLNGLHTH